MTYEQLLEREESKGANLAYLAIGRMMDMVEDETGKYPRWTDEVAPWILDNCK